MNTNTKKVIHFVLEKQTSGTVRYMEVDASGNQLRGDDDGALMPTAYLRKKGLGSPYPEKLTVTISAE